MINVIFFLFFSVFSDPQVCEDKIEIYGRDWEISTYSVAIERELYIYENAILRMNTIEWCWINEEEQFIECEEITKSTPHPVCDLYPHPQYCDFLCCIMMIIDCGCDGCISGSTYGCEKS